MKRQITKGIFKNYTPTPMKRQIKILNSRWSSGQIKKETLKRKNPWKGKLIFQTPGGLVGKLKRKHPWRGKLQKESLKRKNPWKGKLIFQTPGCLVGKLKRKHPWRGKLQKETLKMIHPHQWRQIKISNSRLSSGQITKGNTHEEANYKLLESLR